MPSCCTLGGMSDWFVDHPGFATLVLVVVGLCAMSALYLIGTGSVIAGVVVALVGLLLFGPIRATIDGGVFQKYR